MSEFKCNRAVRTEFLFELHTSVLLQEKKEEMQLRHLYCLVVRVGFQLHYINTDMLRWSCRKRRWCGGRVFG